MDYDPYNFQAFDQSGQLFEMAVEGTGGRMLEVGTLSAGERVRGTIAFDMPRGDATLLMSDESERPSPPSGSPTEVLATEPTRRPRG